MVQSSFECNSPDVVFENFGDEVIFLNLQSGCYYSLDPVGMYFWELLAQGVAPSAILEKIAATYAADTGAIGSDLEALLAEFQAESLIRPSAAAVALSAATEPNAKLPAQYARPTLSKFDDVADMLLLDPVHDVGDAGWPQPAPPAPRAGGA